MSRYEKSSGSPGSPSPSTASSSNSSPLGWIVGVIGILLALVCGWLWNQEKNQASADRDQATKELTAFTNDVAQGRSLLDDTRRVVSQLATKVETREGELAAVSNKLVQTTTELTNTVEVLRDATNQLTKAWADNRDFIEKAKSELGKRDQSIKELLDERGKLEQHILSLNTNLGQFDGRIAEVQRKLADSEKVRTMLVAQNERVSKLNVYWENLFNDPSALTARAAQLKKELAAAHKQLDDGTKPTDTAGMKFELLSDGNVRLQNLKKN